MAAPTKSWTDILDAAVDPDSPLDTFLMTSIRDNLIHLEEWLGGSFTAAIDHNHDGNNSAALQVGANYARNGSFEDDTAGWTVTPFTGGSSAISTTVHINGEKSLSVTSTVLANGGATVTKDEYWEVTGGRFYGIELNLWASVSGQSAKCELVWYDEAQTELSRTEFFNSSDVTTTSTSGFIRRSKLAPSTARFVRLECVLGIPAQGTATGTLYLDGVIAGIKHDIYVDDWTTAAINSGASTTRTITHGLDTDLIYCSIIMVKGSLGTAEAHDWAISAARPDDRTISFVGANVSHNAPPAPPSTGQLGLRIDNRASLQQTFNVTTIIKREESS